MTEGKVYQDESGVEYGFDNKIVELPKEKVKMNEEEELGPLGLAQQKQDKWRSEELTKAGKIIGSVLSCTEPRSQSYPMLFQIMIKLRGLGIE